MFGYNPPGASDLNVRGSMRVGTLDTLGSGKFHSLGVYGSQTIVSGDDALSDFDSALRIEQTGTYQGGNIPASLAIYRSDFSNGADMTGVPALIIADSLPGGDTIHFVNPLGQISLKLATDSGAMAVLGGLGVHGHIPPVSAPAITGSRAAMGVATYQLVQALTNAGYVTDSTTA